MKISLGVKPYLFPMPVLVIATYNEDGTPDIMTMAWGGICDYTKVALNLDENHATADNIKRRGAFTLAIADAAHITEADFAGLVSWKQDPDKFKKTGLHAVKSAAVDAPVIEEFPLTLECTAAELQHTIAGFRVIGNIENVLADERILDEEGTVDVRKLDAAVFDSARPGYYRLGEKIADAFSCGKTHLK